MKNDQLPEGFLATREAGTARVHLPEVMVTASHVLLPMLTRGAAQRLAEALWEADVDVPLERVVLVHDARIPDPEVARFRERLVALFIEGGIEAAVEVEAEPLPTGGAAEAAPPPPPRPPFVEADLLPPAAPPAAAAPQAAREPQPVPEPAPSPQTPAPAAPPRKAFVAPVPSKRRIGSPRPAPGADEG